MPKILVSDAIAQEGIDLLATKAEVDFKRGLKPAELISIIPAYDALVVRSETKVTEEVIKAAKHLKVIARAGIGVDNIDLDAATNAGIAVVNAPIGNTVAAAEHTMALLLSLARSVPQAYRSMKEGQWQRSAFMGIEVRNKSLGIVGLGRVGTEVARRAQGFGMKLLGYDPFVAPEYARRLGIELLSLEDLLARSDFVTLHTPLTANTNKLIGEKQFASMKPVGRLINVARGELVDEDALLKALEEERLAGAALDVFTKEPPGDTPLVQHPKVIVTPHLGASTQEAQREVALEAAEQVLAILDGQPARNTVNAPFLRPEAQEVIAPYVDVAAMLGKFITYLAEGQFVGLNISYEGEIADHDTAILKAAVLAGVLGPVSDERVNPINAPVLAERRGLRVTEQKNPVAPEYTGLITVTLSTGSGSLTLAGTSLRDEPHIVKFNEYWMDVAPSTPYLLFVDNQDQPGSIGIVGTVAGKHNINISFMEVGRLSPRGRAMMVLGLDDAVPQPVLEEIEAMPHINSARLVKL